MLPEYYASVSRVASHPLYWTEFRRERIGLGHAYASAGLALVDGEGGQRGMAWNEGDALRADLSCTNCRLPELLNPGQEIDASGFSPNYRATLEVGMSSYVEPLMPATTRLHLLTEAVASRGMGADQTLAKVKNFLKIRNRGKGAFGNGQIASLRDIERSLFATARGESAALLSSHAAFGPLPHVGVRYDLCFHEDASAETGRYFLGKAVKALMELTSELNSTVQVVVHGQGGRCAVLD